LATHKSTPNRVGWRSTLNLSGHAAPVGAQPAPQQDAPSASRDLGEEVEPSRSASQLRFGRHVRQQRALHRGGGWLHGPADEVTPEESGLL
jgi:hypothetical protein